MRKLIGLLLMLTLCICLACPAFAAEAGFVPSITYKGEPDFVPTEDSEGQPVIGIVREEEKEDILSYVYNGCLLVTPVAEAEESKAIPQAAKETLLYVYEELSSGRMKLPYDKASNYKGEPMVIRELLDLSWLCGTPAFDHDHPTQVEPEGIVFQVTFDLGVQPTDKLIVMTYEDEEWEPIVETINNGDGTVTCVFEKAGAVAISIAQGAAAATGDAFNPTPWIIVMIAALAALVVVFAKKAKKK